MDTMETITRAAQNLNRCVVKYEDAKGEITQRLVEPYSLRQKSTGTLFFGWSSRDRAIRSFRVERLISAFEVPSRFQARFPVEF